LQKQTGNFHLAFGVLAAALLLGGSISFLIKRDRDGSEVAGIA